MGPTTRTKGTINRLSLLRRGIPLLLLSCVISAARLSGAEFTVSADPNTAIVGEQIVVTLRIDGGSVRGTPALPAITGLQQLPGVSSSVNSSMSPSGVTSVQTIAFRLVAIQPGVVVVPPLQVNVDGTTLTSEAVSIKVLEKDPISPPVALADKLVFAWLSLPKTQAYVGETITAELRLYVRDGVANISDTRIPAIASEGFTTGPYLEGSQVQRQVGGVPFTALRLLCALTPTNAGTAVLGGGSGRITAHTVAGRDFFRPLTQPNEVPLSVNEVRLEVRKLPEKDAPASFSGIVGNYELSCTAAPTNVMVGDPITVRIRLSGTGSPAALKTLELPEWTGFRAYEATYKISTNSLGQGTNFIEQILVPENASVAQVPSVSFAFFDADRGAYRTLKTAPIPLQVRASGSAALPALAGTSAEQNRATRDIVPIKQHLGALTLEGPPLMFQPWFLALQGIPVLTLAGAFAWRKRSEMLARNPRIRRRKHVARVVREGLVQLKRAAAANESEVFFATVFRLLQEQLGERLDTSASSITESVIDERVHPISGDEDLTRNLHELFQMCNLARYAPVRSSQELAALVPRVEHTLSKLRDLQR